MTAAVEHLVNMSKCAHSQQLQSSPGDLLNGRIDLHHICRDRVSDCGSQCRSTCQLAPVVPADIKHCWDAAAQLSLLVIVGLLLLLLVLSGGGLWLERCEGRCLRVGGLWGSLALLDRQSTAHPTEASYRRPILFWSTGADFGIGFWAFCNFGHTEHEVPRIVVC